MRLYLLYRPLRGAHGSRPYWRAVAARTMLPSTFGIARREEGCTL